MCLLMNVICYICEMSYVVILGAILLLYVKDIINCQTVFVNMNLKWSIWLNFYSCVKYVKRFYILLR